MFDFIPEKYYSSVQYNSLLIIGIMILAHSLVYEVRNRKSLSFFNAFGVFFIVLYTLYIGLRPLSGYFIDMYTYAKGYLLMQQGVNVKIESDYAFNYFMLLCSNFLPVKYFFLLVDILYVLPCYWFAKIYFRKYWFYAFFMFVGSFSFWSYGTNGIRNGLATSIFILALCFYNKHKLWMYLLFALSFFVHSSLIIPIAAFIVSNLYKNPKVYLYIWLLAIPLSLAGGSFWESLFSKFGFEERTSGYLVGNQDNLSQFSQTGFRWDFLFYSSFGIIAGWYYIFEKKITDSFYIHLFGTYVIANAFWILVIRAAFSNRFAYLSWFLIAAIIAYPMFKYKMWQDQYKIFGLVLTLYYIFTYLMFLKG